ncbi:MAG: sugar ABC transporter permease [Chloroflexi bacterium]|nr:sugar ABC transporter permease [Chloroflexota bacterium]
MATSIKRREPFRWRSLAIGLAFISPAVVGMILFAIWPIVQSLYYSFTDFNVLQSPYWVGWENYRELLDDRVYGIALRNTFYMVLLGLPIHLLFDFLMALLLNTKIRGLSLYRTIFYLPSITPVVASTVVWLWLFNGQYGALNALLHLFGQAPIGWLTNPAWTKPSLIFMGAWFGGNTILIFLAGLRDVPASLLESADLDGANALQKTWHITLPMMSPVIFYTLIVSVIGYFQYFTEAWVLSSTREGAAGGPLNSMLFYAMYLYQNAFQQFKMGYASAQAWILFAMVLIATAILFRTSGWVYYRSED